MASNYTENYQLPLWAADDAFLREEFNDANQKIDAAICEARRAETLADITLAASSDSIILPLEGVDLEKYCSIKLWAPKLISSDSGNVAVRLNNVSGEYYYVAPYNSGSPQIKDALLNIGLYGSDSAGYSGAGQCTIYLFDRVLCGTSGYPLNIHDTPRERILYLDQGWGIHSDFVTRASLTHLTLSSSVPLLAGSHVALFGLRF